MIGGNSLILFFIAVFSLSTFAQTGEFSMRGEIAVDAAFVGAVGGRVLSVPQQYATIQSAVDASTQGDRVIVGQECIENS